MKLLLGAILVAALIVIGVCVVKSNNEKHRLAQTVRRILGLGFLIVLFNMLALFTESERICLFAYTVYFAAADWLLYYMFRFSLEFIGNVFEQHVNRKLMLLLLTVDSISVLLNNVFGHLFDLNPVSLFGGEIYHEIVFTPLFYSHYFIILMLVTFCLISLFYRSVNAPLFYRRKYLVIAIILSAIIVLNICTSGSVFDVSVIGYVIEGICIYYSVFVYSPQRLLPKTLFMVAQDMSVGLFVLDIEGKKLYHNNLGEQFLSTENPLINRDEVTLEEWCRHQYMDFTEEFTKEEVFYRGEEELVLKIQLQRMVDVNKQLQGGYFVIQDRTEEINKLKRE